MAEVNLVDDINKIQVVQETNEVNIESESPDIANIENKDGNIANIEIENKDLANIEIKNKDLANIEIENQVKKPKQRRRYQCYQYTSEQLQLALQKCREGMSIRECSKRFGVPKSTLWDKLANRTPPEMTRKGRCVVTKDVENRLVNWILKMNEEGFEVNEVQVKEAIRLFLDKTTSKLEKTNNRPGKAWYKSFLLRHPILFHIQTSGVVRSPCSDEKLQTWFEESLDTEVPTFVSAPAEVPPPAEIQPPKFSTTVKQMKSALEYIELTIGQNNAQYFRYCKENDTVVEDPMYTAWLTLANRVGLEPTPPKPSVRSRANKRKRKPKHYLSYLSESVASEEKQELKQEESSVVLVNERLDQPFQQSNKTITPSPLRLLQESADLPQNSIFQIECENSMPSDPHNSLLQKSANLVPPFPKKCLLQS